MWKFVQPWRRVLPSFLRTSICRWFLPTLLQLLLPPVIVPIRHRNNRWTRVPVSLAHALSHIHGTMWQNTTSTNAACHRLFQCRMGLLVPRRNSMMAMTWFNSRNWNSGEFLGWCLLKLFSSSISLIYEALDFQVPFWYFPSGWIFACPTQELNKSMKVPRMPCRYHSPLTPYLVPLYTDDSWQIWRQLKSTLEDFFQKVKQVKRMDTTLERVKRIQSSNWAPFRIPIKIMTRFSMIVMSQTNTEWLRA